jgi:2-polyprenyl-3-methyl-5-hydroxy-6-metoxy-1,4-benzoquinol methylase
MTQTKQTETEKRYTEEGSDYRQNNPTWHTEDSLWKAQQIIAMIKRNAMHPKSIAEVGCGAGEILNQLHAALPEDAKFIGYEVSGDALALAKAREKKRLQFKHESLLEAQVHFDLLLMIDVFEHVDDYFGFLRACRSKAENTIFHIPLELSVQNVMTNSLMYARKKVGHIHYFTKDTALATLADTGYEVVDFSYTLMPMDVQMATLKTKIASFPRRLFFSIAPDFAAKTFGGFSLLVLTKQKRDSL